MRSYKILIVEDENIPANYIKKILDQSGHRVVGIADTKAEALHYINSKNQPELILMDIKLKDGDDGIETAEAFQQQTQVAVIYLSAYADDSFLERAQLTKPVGYLVKPVQPKSLLSTIAIGMANFSKDRLSKPMALSSSTHFDPNTQTVCSVDKEVQLSMHESLLLATLLKHPNRLIPYGVLENSAWVDEVPGEGALRTTIWRLRKKLPKGVEIENLYSSGYKISF